MPLAWENVKATQAIVRSAARHIIALHDPVRGVPLLDEALTSGETVDQQAAIATLTALKSDNADALLTKWLDALAGARCRHRFSSI